MRVDSELIKSLSCAFDKHYPFDNHDPVALQSVAQFLSEKSGTEDDTPQEIEARALRILAAASSYDMEE